VLLERGDPVVVLARLAFDRLGQLALAGGQRGLGDLLERLAGGVAVRARQRCIGRASASHEMRRQLGAVSAPRMDGGQNRDPGPARRDSTRRRRPDPARSVLLPLGRDRIVAT
jgi:hypothetical protein